MTPKEFLERLQEIGPGILAPMPLPITIGEQDMMAAKLLLWLFEQMPDARSGQVDDVLDAAKWWFVFWAAAHDASERLKEGDSPDVD